MIEIRINFSAPTSRTRIKTRNLCEVISKSKSRRAHSHCPQYIGARMSILFTVEVKILRIMLLNDHIVPTYVDCCV